MARETLFPPKLSYFKAAFFKSQEIVKIFLSPHGWTACPFLVAYASTPPPVGGSFLELCDGCSMQGNSPGCHGPDHI